jgi:hypothetical protein
MFPPLDAASVDNGDTAANTAAATAAASPASTDHANPDPVMDTRTTGGLRRWTSEGNSKLTSVVTKARKKKWDKEHRIDWVTVTVLVPCRTYIHYRHKWHNTLVSNINSTTARAGHWAADEDKKLREAVGAHGAKDWEKVAASVIGRTKAQCRKRWHDNLVSNNDPTTARAGKSRR